MTPRAVDRENPDRLYTVTGGRSGVGDDDEFDLVALVVAEKEPAPGMQSEHIRILRMCRHPTALVELSSDLELPVSVVRILVRDLLDAGCVTVRRPPPPARAQLPDAETLKQVLVGLQKL